MDIRKLEIFREVCRQKGYSAAAKRMGLTQSAVSQQIKLLEEELGVLLFEQGNRSEATSAGEYLMAEASLLLSHIDDIRNGVRHAAGVGGGTVRFGMIDVAAIDLLPRVLKRFKAAYPNIKLEAVVKATGELVEMVEASRLDFAVTVINNIPESLSSHDVYRDSIVAIVPKGFSSRHDRLSVKDLKGEPLILYPPSSYSRKIIEEAFRSEGVVPTVNMEMHYPAAICSLVQQGMGIGLISELSAGENRMAGQKIVQISELMEARRIGVVSLKRRRLSPQARMLVGMITKTKVHGKLSSDIN